MYQERKEYFKQKIVPINQESETNKLNKKKDRTHFQNQKFSMKTNSNMEIYKKLYKKFKNIKKEDWRIFN